MIAKHVLGNAKNQALLTAAFLIVLTAVLVQFFFLGEELEESRSRAAKLSIAEIIAKNQQQTQVKNASYTNPDNEFARVANSSSLQSNQLAPASNNQSDDGRGRVVEELRTFSRGLQLQGIIKNERHSMAIVRVVGQPEIQTFSDGADMGNGISISQVQNDSIILTKNDVHLTVRMNGNQAVVTDESSLNLPSNIK